MTTVWQKAFRVRGTPVALVLAAVLVVATLPLALQVIAGGAPSDWINYTRAGEHALTGAPIYSGGNWFNYNPLMAYLFGFVVIPLGFTFWACLHLVAAIALPRPLGLLALASFPLWWDVVAGNLVIFVVLAAAWALRGNGWAIGATLLLAMLVPRPIIFPLVGWLLWRYPAWRLRAVVLAVVVGTATLVTGQALEWTHAIAYGAQDMAHEWNLAPSRLVGWAWVPVGVALSVWLLRCGYVGLACLAASPYLLPYYLLFGLLDLRQDQPVLEGSRPIETTGRARLAGRQRQLAERGGDV